MRPFSTCAAVACLAAAVPLSALGQGAIKPVEALVVNPASRPVPVSVVAAAPGPALQCRLDLQGSIASTPITLGHQATPLPALACPAGVSRLDVQRIVLSAFVPEHRVLLALGSAASGALVRDAVIGAVSSGAPDLWLARPVRVDLASAASPLLIADQVCSSGIAGVPQACAGAVYLIGTAVN
jgi:hypothetical protein